MLVVAAAAVAVPAYGSDPVRAKVAALERKVAALEAKLRKQETDNRALRRRVEAREHDTSALRSALAGEATCPVTKPNGNAPPGQQPADTWHGNGQVWIALWTGGVVVRGDGVTNRDGSISVKYGWWRGVAGNVELHGRRLDGASTPFSYSGPDGYGETGFQPTLIPFPTSGCWDVTGTVGDESLTVTLLVVG